MYKCQRFLIVFIVFTVYGFSQDSEAELRSYIKSTIDSVRIKALKNLGKFYAETTGKGDSAIFYGTTIVKFSKKRDDAKNLVGGLSLKAYGYAVNKDFEKAETIFKESLILANKINDKSYLAEIHNRLAAVYENLDEPVNAIDNYIQSIENAKQIKDLRILALSYYGISILYSKQGQVDNQLKYLNQAIDLCEQEYLEAQTKSIILSSASQQFSALSGKSEYKHYKDSSLAYAQKALKLSKDYNLVQSIPSNLLSISIHYLNNGKLDQSLMYSTETLSYIKTMKEGTKLNLYQILAHTYRAKGEKEQCYSFLDSLNKLSIKEKPYYGSIISKYSHNTYKYFEDHSLAYTALDEYFNFENKKKEIEQNKTINELETKYQVQLKENKIKSLTKWLIAVVAIGLLGFLIYYSVRLRKSKEKNRLLKEAIKQQLEFEKELVNVRNNIAQDFHDDLGNKLARISFLSRLVEDELTDADETIKDRIARVKEDSVSLYVGTKDFIFSLKPDSDYLEEVVTYLSDFGEDFFQSSNIKFIVKKDISENIKLPHYWSKQLIFIFKEAMTNVLKHSNAAQLILNFSFDNNMLKIVCEDNGQGFDEKISITQNGLFNMKTRAHKIGGDIELMSKIGEGTKIIFTGTIKK